MNQYRSTSNVAAPTKRVVAQEKTMSVSGQHFMTTSLVAASLFALPVVGGTQYLLAANNTTEYNHVLVQSTTSGADVFYATNKKVYAKSKTQKIARINHVPTKAVPVINHEYFETFWG